MYRKLALLLTLGLLGCAKPQLDTLMIDPTFYPQIELFESLYGVGVNVSITFAEGMAPNMLGSCHLVRENDPSSYIHINPTLWNKITERGKVQLILHELGHCVFRLQHNDTRGVVNGVADMPISIMHTYFFGDSNIYKDNYDWYNSHM